jgi:hypothetical protein
MDNVAAPYLKLPVDASAVQSVTRGLVGDTTFAVLPNITPRMSFILTLAAQIVSSAEGCVPQTLTYHRLPARTHQALPPPNMVQLRSNHDPLRLCLVPLRLARAREGHPSGHHPLQSDSTKRPPTLGSFPPTGSSWTRQPVPPPLHGIRIPRQSRLHDLLADGIPPCLRSPGSRVSTLPLPPLLAANSRANYHLYLLQTDNFQHSSPNPRYFLFDRFSLLYTAIAVPLIAYCSLGHSLIFGARLEFLPLMFISSYSAVGVVASWIGFLVVFFDS